MEAMLLRWRDDNPLTEAAPNRADSWRDVPVAHPSE
jgi:hypothetical protein